MLNIVSAQSAFLAQSMGCIPQEISTIDPSNNYAAAEGSGGEMFAAHHSKSKIITICCRWSAPRLGRLTATACPSTVASGKTITIHAVQLTPPYRIIKQTFIRAESTPAPVLPKRQWHFFQGFRLLQTFKILPKIQLHRRR